MEADIVQIQKMLKTHRRTFKYLASLDRDELRSVLRQAIPLNQWAEVAERTGRMSIQLDELSRAIELAAKN